MQIVPNDKLGRIRSSPPALPYVTNTVIYGYDVKIGEGM